MVGRHPGPVTEACRQTLLCFGLQLRNHVHRCAPAGSHPTRLAPTSTGSGHPEIVEGDGAPRLLPFRHRSPLIVAVEWRGVNVTAARLCPDGCARKTTPPESSEGRAAAPRSQRTSGLSFCFPVFLKVSVEVLMLPDVQERDHAILVANFVGN